ncbi:MAG: DUF432 domain-containing protein [Desulfurococcales archaeon]|nr:DUF432 domain-containing protein [Desulfurococcales archaeon]
MYGPITVGTAVEAGSSVLRLERASDGAMIKYTRSQEGSTASSLLLSPSSKVRLLPSTPRLLPEQGIASCIMTELDQPIVVAPGESVTVHISVPVDVLVESIAGGEDSRGTLIDVFSPIATPKLALYGEPTEGFMCRYWRTSIGDTGGVGTARARITVRNEWEKPSRVGVIILPLAGLRIYYKPGSWDAVVSDAVMSIGGARVADVTLGEPRPPEGYRASPYFEPRKIPGVPPRFSMSWGY